MSPAERRATTGRRPTAAQRYAPRAAWRPWPPCTTLFPRALMRACGSVRLEATREKEESRDAVAMVAGESGGNLPDLGPSRLQDEFVREAMGLCHTRPRDTLQQQVFIPEITGKDLRERRGRGSLTQKEAPPNAQGRRLWPKAPLSSLVHDTHNSQAHDKTSHPHPTPMPAPQIGRPTGRHPAARALSRGTGPRPITYAASSFGLLRRAPGACVMSQAGARGSVT